MLGNLGELVGVLLGDGSIGRYQSIVKDKIKTQYVVRVTLHKKDDLEYSKHVSSLFKQVVKKEPLLRFRRNENTLDLLLFGKTTFDFFTRSIGLIVAPKKNRVRVPEKFIKSEVEKDILRGLFYTDGCIVAADNNGILYPRLEIKMVKSPMQNQIVNMLNRHGFRLGAYRDSAGKMRIQMNGRSQLEKWTKDIGFSNPKNIEKANRFL